MRQKLRFYQQQQIQTFLANETTVAFFLALSNIKDRFILKFLNKENKNDVEVCVEKFRSHTNVDNRAVNASENVAYLVTNRQMNATKHVFTVQCIFQLSTMALLLLLLLFV